MHLMFGGSYPAQIACSTVEVGLSWSEIESKGTLNSVECHFREIWHYTRAYILRYLFDIPKLFPASYLVPAT